MNLQSHLKQWLKLNRVVPLLTILFAFVASSLSLVNVIVVSVPEGIIIALLALLAIDALVERLSVLEKIETRLRSLPSAQVLSQQLDYSLLRQRTLGAREVEMLAVSGYNIISPYLDTFTTIYQNGNKLRFLLLNPSSPSVQAWNLQSRVNDCPADIELALGKLKRLMNANKTKVKGRCEVRLSQFFLPYSIFMIDARMNSGIIVVELHGYGVAPNERPHIILNPIDNPEWFHFFRKQFEDAWGDAKIWQPPPEESA